MTVRIIPRESEEQWLAARRNYVTATDVAKLARGGGVTWAKLKHEKLTGDRTFFGNRFTEWGREREPFIVGLLELMHEVHANDALHVLDVTQWAATPDAIGDGITGEVKTTTKPLGETGDELREIKPEYYDQVQWAMLATESDVCAFAWELHEDFLPVAQEHFLIPRDEERIAELVKVAEDFLAFMVEPDDAGEWDDLLTAYAEAKAATEQARDVLAQVEAQIRERAGDADVKASSRFGSISYTLPKPRTTFDSAAFKKADPNTYEKYTRTTPPAQRTLRVTIKKEDDG